MLLKDSSRTKNNQELVKASIDALVKALEGGHSEALSAYLTAMSQFHNYSFQNILLIASQRPTATRVAGIRAWNELGRRVKRGEKGIMIFAPMIGYKRSTSEADQSQQSDAGTDKPEPRLVGFRAVYVFDVGQTEGAELPELGSTVKGEVGDKLDKLADFTTAQGIKLEYSDKIAPARGMSYGGLIRILPEMEPSETLATFVHELAHEMLHRAERRTLTTKTVRETEAEAVAFVVCHALGLETGTGSCDYIQLYHGDANLLKESLEVVQRTSTVILGAISPKDAVTVPQIEWRQPVGLTSGFQSKMVTMTDAFQVWIGEVQTALRSINMSMEDWQSLWPFDFQAAYNAGTKADDAAMKANRFWWREQNRSLKQDCRLIPTCWLPRGHQGPCQPVDSDTQGAA